MKRFRENKVEQEMVCPNCGHSFTQNPWDFNGAVLYSVELTPGDPIGPDSYYYGTIIDAIGSGDIYCQSCGHEFLSFKVK